MNDKKWKSIFVGYHSTSDCIWKIWDLVDYKIGETTSVDFDENFKNNRSEALLELLQDDIDNDSDDLDIMGTTELNLPTSSFSQNLSFFDSQSVLLLSSLHYLPLTLSSSILPALPKSAQVQLEWQNRKIAKVAQKLQEKQDHKKVAK